MVNPLLSRKFLISLVGIGVALTLDLTVGLSTSMATLISAVVIGYSATNAATKFVNPGAITMPSDDSLDIKDGVSTLVGASEFQGKALEYIVKYIKNNSPRD